MQDGQWEIYEETTPLLGATYGRGRARMVAFGLKGGGLAVVSPGTRGDKAREGLERWGKPRFLVAPNAFHNAGLAEWRRAYPDARVVAHEAARPRLAKKVPAAGPIDDLAELQRELPEGVTVFGPPMARQGETFVRVERGAVRALAVCDAIVNLPKAPLFFWALGFRAKLMTNPLFKRVFLTSRAEYKRFMRDEIEQHPPNVFIPSHGDVLRGEGVAAALLEATDAT